MHIADTLAGLLTMARFTPRPIADGQEYSARLASVAEPGAVCPDGARVVRFTIDASGRWLASVDGWGKALSECDLRDYRDAGQALRAVSGQAWQAILPRLASAREESVRQEGLARMAAGLAKGAKRRQLEQWASQHLAAALALSDAISGPPSAEIAALSPDDLMAALAA